MINHEEHGFPESSSHGQIISSYPAAPHLPVSYAQPRAGVWGCHLLRAPCSPPPHNQLLRNRGPAVLRAPRVCQDGKKKSNEKKVTAKLIEQYNPFPSLRNNEETFFSAPWHKENNLGDLCCLLISLFTTRLFPCCVILTLRAEPGSLFLSSEVSTFPIFICIDCRSFIRRIKQRPCSRGASHAAYP